MSAPEAARVGLAYGLAVTGDVPPGALPSSGEVPAIGGVTVRRDPRAAEEWPPGEVERLLDLTFDDGRAATTIERHPTLGHRMFGAAYGTFVIEPGADAIRYAPEDGSERWTRFLTAQVLPLTALLRGAEVFHASAVVHDGVAIALTGVSGAGKSTTAAELVARGGALLTDDVLAVQVRDGRPIGLQGPADLGLRHLAAQAMAPESSHHLGPVLEADEHKVFRRPPRASAAPVAAFYWIERDLAGETAWFEPLAATALLASTFNTVIRTADRLLGQLDVCAALARQARIERVHVPPSVSASELAQTLLDRRGAPA